LKKRLTFYFFGSIISNSKGNGAEGLEDSLSVFSFFVKEILCKYSFWHKGVSSAG
jgi:hypothetical protein